MIYFNCDYLEGGHPKILEKMLSTNMEQLTGYSTDHYCDSARERIRQACGCPDADVHFLVGGTQTNLTAIASILRPYQGVLAAHDGHTLPAMKQVPSRQPVTRSCRFPA